MKTAIAFVAALMAILTATQARAIGADPPRIEEGEPFPNIVLPSLEGEPMSIADFRGRKVLLHVFASW